MIISLMALVLGIIILIVRNYKFQLINGAPTQWFKRRELFIKKKNINIYIL